MTVVLSKDIVSGNKRRKYPAGSRVSIAIQAGSDVRVWSDNRAPVIATFRELVGSELVER